MIQKAKAARRSLGEGGPHASAKLRATAGKPKIHLINSSTWGFNKTVKYVYLIQSVDHPDQRYTGLASDLKARLAKHNEDGSPHTSKYKPWRLVTFVRFEDDDKASAFEQYLKSGSGRAFANKHLW